MMEGFGCRVQGRTAFGAVQGRPFSAYLADADGAPEIEFRFAAEGEVRRAARQLKREASRHQRWYADAGEYGAALCCLYTPPSDFFARAGVTDVLQTAAGALCRLGLALPPNCPLCGGAGCDAYACLGGEFRPVHAACLATGLPLPEEDTTLPRRRPGHLAFGLAGALFGAVVGAAPIWAIALNSGRIHFALYVFIPILSGLLYRVLRGRASANVGGACVLAASLLAAFALELVWYWMVLTNQFHANLPLWETTRQYFLTHTPLSAIKEMLFNLAALLAGFLAAMRFLRRYAEESREVGGVVRGAAFVRSSAQPIEPGEEAAPSAPRPE